MRRAKSASQKPKLNFKDRSVVVVIWSSHMRQAFYASQDSNVPDAVKVRPRGGVDFQRSIGRCSSARDVYASQKQCRQEPSRFWHTIHASVAVGPQPSLPVLTYASQRFCGEPRPRVDGEKF